MYCMVHWKSSYFSKKNVHDANEVNASKTMIFTERADHASHINEPYCFFSSSLNSFSFLNPYLFMSINNGGDMCKQIVCRKRD